MFNNQYVLDNLLHQLQENGSSKINMQQQKEQMLNAMKNMTTSKSVQGRIGQPHDHRNVSSTYSKANKFK